MKYPLLISLTAALALAGCTTVTVSPGEPEAAVLSKLGKPTHEYQNGNNKLLEYAHGPFGQVTFMAAIGPDGKLASFEQVLTAQKFSQIQVGVSTKQDVQRLIGAPGETSYLSWPQLEVWSYAYREANAWDSMMHVHFDKAGVVQKLMNGPDPHREPGRGLFGRG